MVPRAKVVSTHDRTVVEYFAGARFLEMRFIYIEYILEEVKVRSENIGPVLIP